MLKATFQGHSCVSITDNKQSIIIDPFLTGNPQAAVKAEDIKVDFILATHGHGDHLGDAVDIAKRNNATIIAPNELAIYVQKQGAEAHNMHIGGAYEFPFGRVKLTIAHHGSAAGDGLEYTGNPCGFLIFMDGKTIYHAGDTGLFYDMKLIGEMNEIDLAFLPIGDNFTMGVTDAAKAVEFLNPKKVVPIHYKTWPVIDSEPTEFADKLKDSGTEVIILEPGKSLELS
ncbi:MAG: metal-dependent hydrolase [Candidatus Zixiibacteriota bacterium]|nr:MAG: metal-dependent hydrolase [candidate division Zixibacteria bacterium]